MFQFFKHGKDPIGKKYRATIFDRSNIEQVKLAITESCRECAPESIFHYLSSLEDQSVKEELYVHAIKSVPQHTIFNITACYISIVDDTIRLIPQNRHRHDEYALKIYIKTKQYLSDYIEYTQKEDYLPPSRMNSKNNFHPFLLALFRNLNSTNAVDSNGKKCVLYKQPLIKTSGVWDSKLVGLVVLYENKEPMFVEWSTIDDYSFDPDISNPVIYYTN